ncbi:MAG TPA: glycosyltransferase family 39 protein [Candidatus Goldiibacteriota bacterium]|nr:glycosyltransferase family 39 protein [Candidatus Goldiibacteriota bacterium]HPN63650.1 glycosyltransferase family 39 protein [Candidatus Goldiibacteriota bacterium]HRQ43831.1 glycosyltransferase family 39 protein [Candidatus Goldiibacteriota bacterium]
MKNKYLYAVLIFIVFIIVSDLIWFHKDKTPQAWDESIHLVAAIDYSKAIKSGDPIKIISSFIKKESFYPPLVPFTAALFSGGDNSQDGLTRPMILFKVILIFSVFIFAAKSLGPFEGLIAAILAGTYPFIYSESRIFMFDMPLASVTALMTAVLYLTKGFKNRGFSILLGAVLGMGMLVKWTFFIFAAAPLIYYYIENRKDGQNTGKNLLMCVLSFCVIGMPWYLYNMFGLVKNIFFYSFKQGAIEGQASVFSIQGLTQYFRFLPDSMSWPLLLLFAAGAVLVITDAKNRKFLLFFLIPTVVFSLLSNKKSRYIMAAMPFAAVLSAYAVSRIRGIKLKNAAGIAVILFAVVNFIFASYSFGFKWPLSSRPGLAGWKIEKFFDAIEKGPVTLAVVPDHRFMNNASYIFYTRYKRPDVRINGIFNFPMFSDYFIVKTGDVGPWFNAADRRTRITAEAVSGKGPINRLYSKVLEEDLPDGSSGILYKRISDIRVNDAEFEANLKKNFDNLIKFYLKNTRGLKFRMKRDKGSLLIKEAEFSFKEGFAGDFKHKDAGMKISDTGVILKGLILDPDSLNEGKLRILSLKEIEVTSLNVKGKDIADLARFYTDEVEGLDVSFEGGDISVTGRYLKQKVNIKVSLYNPSIENSNIYFKVKKINFGIISLPSALVNFMLKDYNPLFKLSLTPVNLKFGKIKAENDILQIEKIL